MVIIVVIMMIVTIMINNIDNFSVFSHAALPHKGRPVHERRSGRSGVTVSEQEGVLQF